MEMPGHFVVAAFIEKIESLIESNSDDAHDRASWSAALAIAHAKIERAIREDLLTRLAAAARPVEPPPLTPRERAALLVSRWIDAPASERQAIAGDVVRDRDASLLAALVAARLADGDANHGGDDAGCFTRALAEVPR